MFVLIPAPIAFFIWIKPVIKNQTYINNYIVIIFCALTFITGGTIIKFLSEPIRCSLCQLLISYPMMADKLDEIGFEGGTIFAHYYPHDLAGNLRVEFPEARIISTKFPTIAAEPSLGNGNCLIIWTPKPQGSMNGLGMAQLLNKQLLGELPVKEWSRELMPVPEKFFRVKIHRSSKREVRFGYMFLPNGSGNCR